MLSCKDVSHAVSESLDVKLPWRERLGVKTHLLMCKACQRMARQLELLRSAARRINQPGRRQRPRIRKHCQRKPAPVSWRDCHKLKTTALIMNEGYWKSGAH